VSDPVTIRIQPPTAHVTDTRVALRQGQGPSTVIACTLTEAPSVVRGAIAALDHSGIRWRLADGHTKTILG
jgi:hypothetical protein